MTRADWDDFVLCLRVPGQIRQGAVLFNPARVGTATHRVTSTQLQAHALDAWVAAGPSVPRSFTRCIWRRRVAMLPRIRFRSANWGSHNRTVLVLQYNLHGLPRDRRWSRLIVSLTSTDARFGAVEAAQE